MILGYLAMLQLLYTLESWVCCDLLGTIWNTVVVNCCKFQILTRDILNANVLVDAFSIFSSTSCNKIEYRHYRRYENWCWNYLHCRSSVL